MEKLQRELYLERVLKCAGWLSYEKIEAKEDTTFDSLGFGSLEDIELGISLEEEFDLVFDDEEWNEIKSFKQAIDFILKIEKELS